MILDLTNARWKKSSRSNGNGGNNCVEVAFLGDAVAVRDSKDKGGPALLFNPAEWEAFLGGAKDGEFDQGWTEEA
jgi:Domain of unknown function (DUF397)